MGKWANGQMANGQMATKSRFEKRAILAFSSCWSPAKKPMLTDQIKTNCIRARTHAHAHAHTADFIGKNEKTTIIAKIQKKGGGAPVREQAVDEATQKEMMAFAFKKQQEMKALEEADDDGYMNQPWADSGALKRSMHGTGSIGIGAIR